MYSFSAYQAQARTSACDSLVNGFKVRWRNFTKLLIDLLLATVSKHVPVTVTRRLTCVIGSHKSLTAGEEGVPRPLGRVCANR